MLFMRKSKQIAQNWTICLLFLEKNELENIKLKILIALGLISTTAINIVIT